MNASIGFAEGPRANPIDASNVCAIFAFCSGVAPSSDPLNPVVLAIDKPDQVRAAAGYGEGPELSHLVSRRGKKRCLLVPCTPTTAGVIGSVTQVGQGPTVTAAALTGSPYSGPFDTASVKAKIVDGGAAGVATVSLSWTYSLVNGLPSPLYQPKITIPARAQAQILGTVDLTTLTYAKPAIVTGTVDLTTLTYGPSGTVDTETLSLNVDGGGATVTTFAAPANPTALISQINAALGADVASLGQQNQLVLTGATLGTTGSIVTGSSTAATNLGVTASHTTNGTAGTLDGLTLIFTADTGGSQTVTFSSSNPGSPADVVAEIDGATGIAADVYTAKNVLRLRSTTKGSASTLTITGGTGRTALGLPLAEAAGAESTISIPHLGIALTMGPSSNGSFVARTVYSVATVAPKMSDADIILRIADLRKSGYAFGSIMIASEIDAVSSLARAQMLDARMVSLHSNNAMKRAGFGLSVNELDTDVKTTFAGFTSAWVMRFARGCYLRVSSNIPGGGNMLRSPSWLGAVAATFLPYWKDIGDHGDVATYDAGIVGLPDVDGITADEALVTTPLVAEIGASETSCNVLTLADDGGYYFEGGYTSAPGTSDYCDQNVTNVILRAAQITAAVLGRFQNDTELDTDDAGHLTGAAAAIVDGAVEHAIDSEMAPAAIQGVTSTVDTSTDFYTLKSLSTRIVVGVRKAARKVSAVIGPGLVASAAD